MDDDDDNKNSITSGEKRTLAIQNIQHERERWKKRIDERHLTPTLYHEGDLVLIANEPQATGDSRKLEPKYRGPYIVTRELGNDRYLIKDIPGMQITSRKFSSVFSSDKMRPWCVSFEFDLGGASEVEDDLESGVAELST